MNDPSSTLANTDPKLIAENLRFFRDMRFKRLTLFTLWTAFAGAGIGVFGTRVVLDGMHMGAALARATLLFTAVIWIMEVRSTLDSVAQCEALGEAASVVWPTRNVSRWTGWSLVTSTNAIVLLYVLSFVFWSDAVLRWGGGLGAFLIIVSGGVLLLGFTFTSYRPLWMYAWRGGRSLTSATATQVMPRAQESITSADAIVSSTAKWTQTWGTFSVALGGLMVLGGVFGLVVDSDLTWQELIGNSLFATSGLVFILVGMRFVRAGISLRSTVGMVGPMSDPLRLGIERLGSAFRTMTVLILLLVVVVVTVLGFLSGGPP